MAVSCSVGHRRSLDPELLWVWLWLAAVALIQPLAWELPCVAASALKERKKEKERADGNSWALTRATGRRGKPQLCS